MMFGFLFNAWNWTALQEWWLRGSVGALIGALIFIVVPAAISYAAGNSGGIGGKGGSGTITGGGGSIIGGRGGEGGPRDGGRGGEGGSGAIMGGSGTIIGGDGGNAGGWDGRGGRASRSPGEVAGLPTEFWRYGRGGAGANSPEFNRRLGILTKVRSEYVAAFPDMAPFVQAGLDQIPITWVNKRLEELGENWRVTIEKGEYKMPPLPGSP
jgi:hypothetical protein